MFDCVFLCIDLNEWKSPDTAGTPPSPRQGHVAAVLGGVLYVHGGMAGQTFLDDLHCLDLSKRLKASKEDRGRPYQETLYLGGRCSLKG